MSRRCEMATSNRLTHLQCERQRPRLAFERRDLTVDLYQALIDRF